MLHALKVKLTLETLLLSITYDAVQQSFSLSSFIFFNYVRSINKEAIVRVIALKYILLESVKLVRGFDSVKLYSDNIGSGRCTKCLPKKNYCLDFFDYITQAKAFTETSRLIEILK